MSKLEITKKLPERQSYSEFQTNISEKSVVIRKRLLRDMKLQYFAYYFAAILFKRFFVLDITDLKYF